MFFKSYRRFALLNYFSILQLVLYFSLITALSKFDDTILFRVDWPGPSDAAAPDELLRKYDQVWCNMGFRGYEALVYSLCSKP